MKLLPLILCAVLASRLCHADEEESCDLKRLERAIRIFDDKTIEAQKGKSWPDEYYELTGPQLKGKPLAHFRIGYGGGIGIWFIRRYVGWESEEEENSGVDKHLIVFCDDAQWMSLCEIMNKWLLPEDKKPEVYEKADNITIWFKREEIPLVMERLVTRVWRIPPSEFRVVWRHRYPQM